MDNKFVQHFSKISPLSAEEAAAIEASMRVENFKKGTLLLREGQVQVNSYFILEGCIREYILIDGEEKTTNFFTEEQWVISLGNFSAPSHLVQLPTIWSVWKIHSCRLGTSVKPRKCSNVFPVLKPSPERL